MALSWLPTSLVLAAVMALLFRNTTPNAGLRACAQTLFAARTPGQWAVRLLAAWLAFPVVYFIFGMPVGLVVEGAYRNQEFGLRLPGVGVIAAVQLVRGMIVLLASLPLLIVWSGSRRRFWITYGVGLFILLGLYGLIQAYWLPWGMRVLHTFEILLDSMVNAWLLATFVLPPDQPRPGTAATTRSSRGTQ